MTKGFICTVLVVFLACLGAGTAYGESCTQLTLKLQPQSTDLDPTDFDFLAAYFGVDPFGWCWSQPVVGTIQGVWAFCGNDALAIFNPFSVGVGPDLWGNPGVVLTKEGDLIYMISYGLSVWNGDTFVGFGGMTRISGGTGAYEGATGWTADRSKRIPTPTYAARLQGFLCLPD